MRATSESTTDSYPSPALRPEQFLPRLLDFLRDVVYVSSAGGTLIWVSQAFETITGSPRAAWQHKPFSQLLHPDDLERARVGFACTLRGEVPPLSEYRIRRADGGYATVELLARPVEHRGRVIGTFGVARDVTERVRTHEALRESEERFLSAFQNAAIGMAITVREGQLIQVNEAFCRMTGYTKHDLLTRTWQDITHPDDIEKGDDAGRRVIQGEVPYVHHLEKRYIHKDGHTVWAELAISCVRNDRGEPMYFLVQAQDVTDRKVAAQALRESEERFRSAFDHAPIGMAIATGVDKTFKQVNEAFARMLGYSQDELLAMNWRDVTHPDDIARGEEITKAIFSGKADHVHRQEKRYVRRDGRIVWGELSIGAVRGPAAQPESVIAQVQDITERKRAEEALRESEERYRHLVEDINDVIFELSADATIQYISPVVEQLTGHTPSELVGRHASQFIHPDDMPSVAEAIKANLSGDLHPSEYRVITRTGEYRWVRSFSRLIRDGDQILGLRGVQTDITGLKESEEALVRAREELEGRVEKQIVHRNPYALTFRELTVLHLLTAGRSDKEIGTELGISPLTARKHTSNILAKMGASSRTEAVARALREGLLD